MIEPIKDFMVLDRIHTPEEMVTSVSISVGLFTIGRELNGFHLTKSLVTDLWHYASERVPHVMRYLPVDVHLYFYLFYLCRALFCPVVRFSLQSHQSLVQKVV